MIIKQTTLDLNGPELSFITHPSSATINSGGSATLTSSAVISFPTQDPVNPATNTGYISYRWYANGYGALSDGTISSLGVTLSGTNTTTLSVTSVMATANGRGFYLVADYIPSAYSQPEGSAVVVGTARSTGKAFNDPKSSNVATLIVNPVLYLSSNPSSQTIAENEVSTFSASAFSSDGSPVNIQWQINGSNIPGATSTTLRISQPTAATYSIRAKFTHPTASNSPIYSGTATFTVVIARAILNYEVFRDDLNGLFGIGSIDLAKQSGDSYTFSSSGGGFQSTVIYAPERDINVAIEVAGAAGGDYGANKGGHGGITKIKYTIRKNREYVLKIGSTYGSGSYPAGGTPNGGGMSILYHGSVIVAIGGGGGGSGIYGSGGDGGAAQQGGNSGTGRGSGRGGGVVYNGGLPISGGTFGSDTSGGIMTTCAIGKYWRERGYSPCSFMGGVYLYDAIGRIINGTTNTIVRGFKPGKGFRNNAGRGVGISGGGGGGARGGDASSSSTGGGGGSGYWNGEGSMISSLKGGNTSGRGYIKITVL